MNFQTHATLDIYTAGCGLMGIIKRDYDAIVKTFGEPTEGFDKTDAEWHIRFDDGTVATIYNYKDGINYNGDRGLPVQDIKEWHVGGKSIHAYYLVFDEIGKANAV